jgi:hypothetical protein
MARHSPAPGEHLDRAGRRPDVDSLADEAVRDAVVVALDLDVVVDVDPGSLPDRVLVRDGRQRPEGRPVERREQTVARACELAERPGVEPGDPLADRPVGLGEGKEPAVAEGCRDPAFGEQDPCSTFALSRGLYGRAGMIAVP